MTTVTNNDVLQQQLQMLGLVLDMEQNRDDIEFDKQGGRIHYVLDENVFEMFVYPKPKRTYVSTFSSSFWRKVSKDHGRWGEFAAQSAMVASEVIFSGRLPGQGGDRLYMSEWHRAELTKRIVELSLANWEVLKNADLSTTPTELEKELAELLEIKRKLGEQPSDDRRCAFAANDDLLREDLRTLSAQGKDYQSGLDRFAVARIAARFLAKDQRNEPLEQLVRIKDKASDVEGPIEDRLYNPTYLFAPAGTDFAQLAASARAWHRRLQSELVLAGRPAGDRSAGALWNDANTLALVTWAAGRCDRDQERMVLITGDVIVFNAYRRWFLDEHLRAPGEPGPFALRRLVQYAPILNMNGPFSDMKTAEQVTEASRQAMEVALLPFNLSSMSSSAAGDRDPKPTNGSAPHAPDFLRRGREYLTLKYVDRTPIEKDPALRFFIRRLPDKWFHEQHKILETLCALWKQNERIAIGSMYGLIDRRLNNSQKHYTEMLEVDRETDIGEILSQRAHDLMERILDGNVELWLPAAGRFVDNELRNNVKEGRGRMPLRAPISPRIVIQDGKTECDLVDLIERWLRGDDPVANRLLSFTEHDNTETQLAFAIASGLAFGLLNWSNADLYAGLAVRAAMLSKTTPPDQPYELRYMHAVAKRFRVGEIGTPKHERTAAALRRRYNDANKLLEQCLHYHLDNFQNGRNHTHPHVLPLVRSFSERAALRGFYAASIAMADTSTWQRAEQERQSGVHAMNGVVQDLGACYRLSDSAQTAAMGNERFLLRLQRQFVSNFAAFRVVNRLLYGDSIVPVDLPSQEQIMTMIDQLKLLDGNLPILVHAELLAFFIIGGRDVSDSRSKLSELLTESKEHTLLALDSDLLNIIGSLSL